MDQIVFVLVFFLLPSLFFFSNFLFSVYSLCLAYLSSPLVKFKTYIKTKSNTGLFLNRLIQFNLNSNRAELKFIFCLSYKEPFWYVLSISQGMPGGPTIKNMPANAENKDSIPGSGRSPEKGKITHSIILAWEIPWTEETGRLQSMGSPRVGYNFVTEQQQLSMNQICFQMRCPNLAHS